MNYTTYELWYSLEKKEFFECEYTGYRVRPTGFILIGCYSTENYKEAKDTFFHIKSAVNNVLNESENRVKIFFKKMAADVLNFKE